MSAAIIKAATAAGICFMLDGDKLVMKASRKPPDALLAAIRTHKSGIIEHLRVERFVAAVRVHWPGAHVVARPDLASDNERKTGHGTI